MTATVEYHFVMHFESVMFAVIYTSRRRDVLKAPKRTIFDHFADKLWTVVIGGQKWMEYSDPFLKGV